MSAATELASFDALPMPARVRVPHIVRGGSLRRRLALLAFAACVPMLLLFTAEGLADYQAEHERAGQRQLEVARSMAATVERELGGVVASLQAMALLPHLQAADLADFKILAGRFIATQPAGTALILLDRSGQQLVNTSVAPGRALKRRNPALNEVLTRRVFETGQAVISNLSPGEASGSLIVTAEVPVLRFGHVAYDLSAVLSTRQFSSILVGQHLKPGTVVSIFDRNGVNVARIPDHGAERPASNSLLPALLSQNEGVIGSTSIEGVKLLTAFSHAEPSGWSVAIGVPEAWLSAPLRQRLMLLLWAGLIGLAASLGAAYALGRRVLVPIRDLARFAADPSKPMRVTQSHLCEVDAVAAALRHSLDGRLAAMRALQQLNEDLELRVRQEIASREQAQARLAQAQHMETLGQLAGGIAHDFNNVLQAVSGGLSLIKHRAGDADEVRRLSGMAADAAGRGAAITGRLLTFSRRGDLQAVSISPSALLGGLRDMLVHILGAGITVKVAATADLPCLLADKAQLEAVLVNLAINARDAMPDGGTLCLSATAEGAPSSRFWPQEMRAGHYVRLALTDSGTGMDAATLARASEPFFTTKGPSKGTGLGLAMARGFAQQSGGGFQIQSTLGRGTTVALWFPEAGHGPTTARPAAEASLPADAALPPMRVLLVDDESMIREAMAHVMEDHGFAVTTASDAAAALALLDGGHAIDLLITDYAMPGLTGVALIEAARRRCPNLPALLLTGYAEEDIAVNPEHHRLTVRLAKPISGEELAASAAKLRRRSRPA